MCSTQTTGCLWASSDGSVQARIKKDLKCSLIWIRHQQAGGKPAQVCQIKKESFAVVDDGVELMIQIAKEWVAKKVESCGLYARRDELFNEYKEKNAHLLACPATDADIEKSGVMKRPSAVALTSATVADEEADDADDDNSDDDDGGE